MTAGKVPNASQRAKQLAREVDEAENTLATAIGQAVALQLGQLLQPIVQMLPHVAKAAAGQKEACLYCAARAKLIEVANAARLADAQREYEIVCKAAAELDDAAPEFAPPEMQPVPGIQEMFVRVPVVVAKGYPPCPVGVCYDDLPTKPAEPADVSAEDEPAEPAEPAGPAKVPFRPVGLVTPDGRQILAPNE